MIVVLFKREFVKNARRYRDNDTKSLIKSKIALFIESPHHSTLKTHKLTGKMKGLWAFSIKPDLRIILEWIDTKTVVFHTIGTHSQVYR